MQEENTLQETSVMGDETSNGGDMSVMGDEMSNGGDMPVTGDETSNGGASVITRRERIVQIIKFVCFSASAGVVQLGSFALMDLFIGENLYWLKYIIALTLSVLWNFTFNREFTFKSAANVPIAMLKIFGFYAVFAPLSTIGGNALAAAGWHEYLVLALTMVLNMVLEFLFCTFVVYRNSMNTKQKANNKKVTNTEDGI